MRIKIGNSWYTADPGQPIMVELTEADKQNIANMASDARCYALFDDGDLSTDEQKREWMREGSTPRAQTSKHPL